MGSIVAFVNMKGGVGKTTTTINLAACLARDYNKRVLIVDLDSQINATLSLMSPVDFAKLKKEHKTLRNLVKQSVSKETQPRWAATEIIQTNLCGVNGLDILPGDIELYEDFVLADIIYERSQGKRENFLERWQDMEDTLLKRILRPIAPMYDFVLLDFSPGDHLMTRSGILASDYYVIPAKPEPLSVIGIGILEGRIKQFKDHQRSNIKLLGITFTSLGRTTKMAAQVQERLERDFGKKSLFQTAIPINVAIARAVDFYKPVVMTEPKSTGAKAYKRLANEFLYRWQQRTKNPDLSGAKSES
ncbi:ParA family protein [[Limnothrix rosea] IAM M-220]|uniref:ParA family protein n=1 Tax=[Limnothrix rosea] IAM M-220 TaxID=454133 RepID=UPI00095E48EE|nr:ParA family protein [[Limnothrix rosea] IAM M-220]OKH13831.1 cobyrinic acid a,c-diamide synthase [[Limnothrix rosea] IAM M-220]